MAKLQKLTYEQVETVCGLHLDNYSYNDIALYVKENFDVNYTRQSFGEFFRSKEGIERVQEVSEKIRDEWINEPLAEKSSRIHALQEQATKLQRMLRNLPPEAIGSQEYYKLSQEFRGYMAQLRQETEPLRVQKDEKIMSPFEWLFDEDVDAKQTEEVQPEGSNSEEEDSLSEIRLLPPLEAKGDSLPG